ncbi:MAG: hypothetical protein ABIH23_14510 [bacterium]
MTDEENAAAQAAAEQGDKDQALADQAAADLAAADAAVDDAAADGAVDEAPNEYELRIAALEKNRDSINNKYRTLVQSIKAGSIPIERNKRRGSDNGDYDDEARSSRSDAARQAEFERRMADGEMDDADILVEKITRKLEPQIRRMNDRTLAQMTEKSLVRDEYHSSMTMAAAIADEYGLSEKEGEEVYQKVAELGIDIDRKGGPARFAAVMVPFMENLAYKKVLTKRTNKAETDAEERVRLSLLAKQPGKGAAPTKKEQTPEQKALDKMREVAPRSVAHLLDSERNK